MTSLNKVTKIYLNNFKSDKHEISMYDLINSKIIKSSAICPAAGQYTIFVKKINNEYIISVVCSVHGDLSRYDTKYY